MDKMHKCDECRHRLLFTFPTRPHPYASVHKTNIQRLVPLSLGTPLHKIFLPLLVIGNPSCHLSLIFHAYRSPSASATTPHAARIQEFKKEARGAALVAIQAQRLQVSCCKDYPEPIAGTGLAGDDAAAANFKCLLCAGLFSRMGAGADSLAGSTFPFSLRRTFFCAIESALWYGGTSYHLEDCR
jgi:hypothetical protein